MDELLRHEGDAVENTLLLRRGGVGDAIAGLVDGQHGEVGDAAVELAFFIPVIGSAVGVGRVFGDAGHLEGLAVVEAVWPPR